MGDKTKLIESIFRQEENVLKFNAAIMVPNLDKSGDYFYTEGKYSWFCSSFHGYVQKKEYMVPNFIYFFDKKILLMVFWLNELPREKDILNAKEFVEYINKYPPKVCQFNNKEGYTSGILKNPSIEGEMEIRYIFMVSVDKYSSDNEIGQEVIDKIVYYRYTTHESSERSIHCTTMLTDNPNIKVEVQFFNDANRYFIVTNPPHFTLFKLINMKRASLRDICIHNILSYEPGVYALIYKDKLKKIGKAEAGIYQRVKDYYKEDGAAGGYITEQNKDEIEVAWANYPRNMCADFERLLQFLAKRLGEDLEWDKRYEFKSKGWQDRSFGEYWSKILNITDKDEFFK